MTMRLYFAQPVGDGRSEATAYRPATRAILPSEEASVRMRWWDGRPNGNTTLGTFLVAFNGTDAEHALLVADPRVTYLPIEDALGNPLSLADPIGDIPLAKRNVISAACEVHHVPLAGLKGSDPIRFLVRRIRIRFLMRDILRSLDLTEGLDTLISAIPVARRQAITARLTESGFSSRDAGVLGSDTVQEAIVKMILEREESDRGE